jgi:glucose/arabinose dehydrogenase
LSALCLLGGAAARADAFLESGGVVVMEAEHADTLIGRSSHDWTLATSKSGYSGDGYLQTLPNNGGQWSAGYATTSPEMVFNVEFATAGTYYIWIRGQAESGNDDSCHAGVDGTTPASADRITGFNIGDWVWRQRTMDGVPATVEVPTAGAHTIHVWAREDGIKVDRILLRTDSSSTEPSGLGPAESPRTAPGPDVTPPQIGAVGVSGLTPTGATITWTTDEPADSQVEYGPDAAYGQSTSVDDTDVTSHLAALTGLHPETLYHFRVFSADAAGNLSSSSDGTFTTLAATDQPFVEVNGQVVMEAEHADENVARSSHAWTPGTALGGYSGTGYVEVLPNNGGQWSTGYTTTSPELSFDVFFSTVGTYYVWVRGSGATGNDDSLHAGLDDAGPATADRLSSFISVSWVWKQSTMDGPVATLNVAEAGLHTVHLWAREDGLKVDKLLLRMESSSDPPLSGGPPESPRGFPDETPPALSDVEVAPVTTSTATVTWTTDEPATSRVEYGPTPGFGQATPLEAALVTEHTVVLVDLTSGTSYDLRVRSTDATGNEAVGATLAVAVPAADPAQPAVSVLSPAQQAVLTPGPVPVEFAVQNFVLGDQGEPHLHLYLDDDPVVSRFFNGTTQQVLRDGVHTHAIHWRDAASVELLGLSTGLHRLRLVLADAANQELTNPEAGHTLLLTVTSPPAGEFDLEPVAANLNFPVALAFAPDGRLFYNELGTGTIRIIEPDWDPQAEPFADLDVHAVASQGLFGIAFDPDFENTGYLYVFHTAPTDPPVNRVVRLTDVGGQGADATVIVDGLPAGEIHNGGILRFGPDGTLYVSVGEANDPNRAQDPDDLAGKILRYHPDGTVPADNPTPGSPVYALGLRNTFGMTFHPHTGDLWITDNGPEAEDEVDRIVPGGNYGWPTVIGIVQDPRFIDPLVTFTPTIGPTGIIAVSDATGYPEEYHDNLLFTDHNGGKIRRLRLAGEDLRDLGSVTEAYTGGQGLLLDLAEGPDGFIYVTSATGIFRVVLRSGLSGVAATALTPTGATIIWTTDEPADSQVEYGPDAAYGQSTPVDPALVTSHAVVLGGLSPGTPYHFRVRSVKAGGQALVSADSTFTTPLDLPPAFIESGGQVVMEAEHADQLIPRSDRAWEFRTSKSGYAGEGYLQALPDAGLTQVDGYQATSPEMVFNVEFATAGTYSVWIRGQGDNGNADSCHAGLDGAAPPEAMAITGFNTGNWVWKRTKKVGGVTSPATLFVPAPGRHTIHLWMREDGIKVDKLLLRTSSSSTAPSGTGPAESPRTP